jgi:hypothetical protein
LKEDRGSVAPEDAKGAEYEAPEVERVMDAEELGREVHYAGVGGGGGPAIPISDIPT